MTRNNITITGVFLAFMVSLCMNTASGISQNEKIKKPFPSEVDKQINFGMSLDDYMKQFGHQTTENENSASFRTVLLQKINSNDVSELVFYFDNDNDKPLYEIIVNFTSEEMAMKAAGKLLGNSNFNEKEWRFLYKKMPIWCWVYKNKIVYAARIPDSEWADEWDKH